MLFLFMKNVSKMLRVPHHQTIFMINAFIDNIIFFVKALKFFMQYKKFYGLLLRYHRKKLLCINFSMVLSIFSIETRKKP